MLCRMVGSRAEHVAVFARSSRRAACESERVTSSSVNGRVWEYAGFPMWRKRAMGGHACESASQAEVE